MSVRRLSNNTVEASTNIVTVTFKDDAGALAVPNSMYWTLTDRFGSIINARSMINFEVDDGTGSVGILSSAMKIVLNGADLNVASKSTKKTVFLTVEGEYDSTGGTDLPYKDQCSIDITNLVAYIRYVIKLDAGIFKVSGGLTTFTAA